MSKKDEKGVLGGGTIDERVLDWAIRERFHDSGIPYNKSDAQEISEKIKGNKKLFDKIKIEYLEKEYGIGSKDGKKK